MNEIEDKIEGICQDCIYLNAIIPIIKQLEKEFKDSVEISVGRRTQISSLKYKLARSLKENSILRKENKTLKEKLDISVSDYDIVYDYFSQINKILNTELIEDIKNKILYLQKRDIILTEFEKWLEETIKALKLSQQKLIANLNISNSSKARYIREFNLRITTNSICLDKLQELKGSNNIEKAKD